VSDADATHERYWRLRQPIAVNACTVPNRIVRTAHATGYAPGRVTDRLIGYHEARARGGVGLSFLEIAGIHPSTPGPIMAFHESVMDGWSKAAAAVHRHDKKLFQQLWHGGSNAAPLDGGPAWSPSGVPEPINATVPVAMTPTMIDEVVEGFAVAAGWAREAGLDGVEVHGAHGYLVGQFLSPATNRRSDDYGGSLENRARLLRRILGAIRAAVGPSFPVGVRLSGTEGFEGGIQPDEAARTAALVESEGLVDFVNVSMGSYYAFPKFIGAMHEPLGYELATSTPVTAAVSVPTIVTGRIMDLHDAEQLLAQGISDMVSMVRATIADPDIVAKSFAGQEARVRPCLSCNQGCVGGLFGPDRAVGCVVNPTVGTEHLGLDPFPAAARERFVLVVGAGPAGLEAAATAARRGHRVVVHDAAPETGGATRWARRAPLRQDIATICDWLTAELVHLGVEVRAGSLLTAAEIVAMGPDTVVVATGGEPRRDGHQRFRPATEVPGVGLAHVATPIDVLGGWHQEARHALVFDDLGTMSAISVAEHLLERGCAVTFATSLGTVGAELGPSLQRDPAQGRLGRHDDFRALTRVAVAAIEPDTVLLRNLDSGRETRVDADLVVLELGVVPRRSLFDELGSAGIEARLVGDALAPRDIQHAIATGRRVGAEL